MAAQLVFVREYLAQFQGNEIVIALIFFCWLVFGGMGTAAARDRGLALVPPSPGLLVMLCGLLAVLAVCQVVAIRWLRDLLFMPGAAVGVYGTFGYIAITMAPYALLVGFVLPYSLLVARLQRPDYPGNLIYMADNAGDVAGAALFSFVLVFWLTPFQILLAVHAPLLVTILRLPATRRRRTLTVGFALVVLVGGVAWEDHLLPLRDGRRMLYAESRYGRLEVVESGGQITLFADGLPAMVSHDPALAEESVHFALSQLDRHRHVLLVASIGNMLTEVAKYRPERVDYVELDPMVARLQRQFGWLTPVDGLTVIAQDARSYLAATDTRYDAILINLPEPETYQVNRFFTAEFFALAKRRLTPQGVLSFAIEGAANYISPNRQQKLSSLANTAGAQFAHVVLMPGQRLFFLCSDRRLTTDIPQLLEDRGIHTLYIRGHFSGDLTRQRIRQINQAVDPRVPLNEDLSPRLMRLAFLGWFQRHGESPIGLFLVLAAAALAAVVRMTRPQRVLLTTGCIAIGAEMVAIFTFQAVYGYIYLQLGVLVTVFLAGMLPGAWIGGRYAGSRRWALACADLFLSLLLVLFALLLTVVPQSIPSAVLYGFGLLVSLVCGFQFPIAWGVAGDDAAAASQSFSADLVGAALGVLLVSLVLIPLLGIVPACFCLAGLKLISFMVSGSIHASV